jgi:hypothetical protein
MFHIRYLTGLGCVLAVGTCFFLGVDMSGAGAGPEINRAALATHDVDRSSKGDRLSSIAAHKPAGVKGRIGADRAAGPANATELPEGCESIVSTIGRPALARVAGRCLS